jgi:short-subunit dehydrogenase
MAPYSATKFAVVSITESLKVELDMLSAPIAVSLLAPGPVRSAIFDDPFSGNIHPATQKFVDALRTMIGQHGMDPEPFAAAVFDAIERGDYWIVPQPEALDPMLEQRHKMIAERAQPRFDFFS